MDWQIEYQHMDVVFTRSEDNSLIRINGVDMTDHEGWMHVQMPLRSVYAGAPCIVSVRLAFEMGTLAGRDIIVAGRVYDSLTDVIAVCSAWGVDVGAALHDEIARCARVGLAADAPRSESALPRKRVLRRFATADRQQRSN